MTRQQRETANARSRNFCRQAALSLIAAGTVYAAPIIMPLNEALAASQPPSAIAASQPADSDRRSGERHGSRGTRPSRSSRPSRPSRYSRGSRGSR